MGASGPRSDDGSPVALPDWEPDCDVDLADFAAFQDCFDRDIPATEACIAAFDIDERCGFVDVVDYGPVVGALLDDSFCGGPLPHPTCAEVFCPGGQSMAASGGGDAPLDSGDLGGHTPAGAEGLAPPAPAWEVALSTVVVEIRPLGGGAPLTILAPDTEYEIHYSGAAQAIQGYLLDISEDCVAACITSASPWAVGPWSQAGLFEYLPLEGSAWVLNDLSAADADSSLAAPLCTITTGSEAVVILDLRMYSTDPVAAITYEMVGQTTVVVSAP